MNSVSQFKKIESVLAEIEKSTANIRRDEIVKVCVLTNTSTVNLHIAKNVRFEWGKRLLGANQPTFAAELSDAKIDAFQVSFRGLKAFTMGGDGETKRQNLFTILESEYGSTDCPVFFFVFIGVDDMTSSEISVTSSLVENFLNFFKRLNNVAPTARVHWVGFGAVSTNHPRSTTFHDCRDIITRNAENFPPWLHFEDLCVGYVDKDFKANNIDFTDEFVDIVGRHLTRKIKNLVHWYRLDSSGTCISRSRMNGK